MAQFSRCLANEPHGTMEELVHNLKSIPELIFEPANEQH